MNLIQPRDIDKTTSIISDEFMEHGFNFWFTDHEHIRSPFPEEIHDLIRINTTSVFLDWVLSMKEIELNEINEDEFVEMFETILFNEAMKLVEDEDRQLTISYPFLPRIGDKVKHNVHGEGKIAKRKAIVSKENKKLFRLIICSEESGQEWETEFELTA